MGGFRNAVVIKITKNLGFAVYRDSRTADAYQRISFYCALASSALLSIRVRVSGIDGSPEA